MKINGKKLIDINFATIIAKVDDVKCIFNFSTNGVEVEIKGLSFDVEKKEIPFLFSDIKEGESFTFQNVSIDCISIDMETVEEFTAFCESCESEYLN